MVFNKDEEIIVLRINLFTSFSIISQPHKSKIELNQLLISHKYKHTHIKAFTKHRHSM